MKFKQKHITTAMTKNKSQEEILSAKCKFIFLKVKRIFKITKIQFQ